MESNQCFDQPVGCCESRYAIPEFLYLFIRACCSLSSRSLNVRCSHTLHPFPFLSPARETRSSVFSSRHLFLLSSKLSSYSVRVLVDMQLEQLNAAGKRNTGRVLRPRWLHPLSRVLALLFGLKNELLHDVHGRQKQYEDASNTF